MSAMSVAPGGREPEPEITLGDNWWRIPLGDEAASSAKMREFVDYQFGRAEELSMSPLEIMVMASACAMNFGESQDVIAAISLEPESQFPPGLSGLAMIRVPGTLDEIKDRLRADGVEFAEIAGPLGPMVRSIRGTDTVTVTYWLDPGDGSDLYRALFDNGHPELKEQLVDYFDRMISTFSLPDSASVDRPQ